MRFSVVARLPCRGRRKAAARARRQQPAGERGSRSASPGAGHRRHRLWARRLGVHRLALAEALLFAQPNEREDEACRQALERDLRFSVIGHVNGTYSLAATNRRLALALEKAWPGAVRIDQVEGQPVRDLTQVPTAERPAIDALAGRERHEDGFEVELVHHWPVWPPPHPAALKLAHVPWEESVAPRDMVRVINEKYHGVVVQTRFVAKALINSGVRLPIRWIGCAIDLDAYAALGAARGGVPASRRPTASAPFVFLHVSSCLPRKGVNVLIAAYARAFRRTNAVRLVIKGFENEHNDVPERIARLRGLDPRSARDPDGQPRPALRANWSSFIARLTRWCCRPAAKASTCRPRRRSPPACR